ncbi:hypothetical protein [Halioglobus sp. HI00S01]|nr:hypothetical protein [Halioglobus sp. HI00S01]
MPEFRRGSDQQVIDQVRDAVRSGVETIEAEDISPCLIEEDAE